MTLTVTAVKAVVVNARLRNWVFVKVETSEPGLIGWGEATLEWKTNTVVGAIKDLEPLVLGQDPRRLEHLWQSMYRHHFFHGGVTTMSAISGIDQALHDVVAKDRGVPIYQLLGGAVRDRVRMYDHLGGGASDAVYDRATAEEFALAAQRSVADGFSALKILAVPIAGQLASTQDLDKADRLMGSVRDAVGPDIDIMVDFHGRTTPAAGIQYANVLAPYNPWFIEEPCAPGDPQGMAYVASRVSMPVATGERIVSRRDFLDLFQARACAVIQPDICHCGGPTEMRKVAAMAELFQVSIAPHNPLGPIATAHNLHFAVSSPNHLIQEVMRSDVPWRDEVVIGDMPINVGHMALPTTPGLGLEIDEAAAHKYPYQPEPVVAPLDDFGSVRDW